MNIADLAFQFCKTKKTALIIVIIATAVSAGKNLPLSKPDSSSEIKEAVINYSGKEQNKTQMKDYQTERNKVYFPAPDPSEKAKDNVNHQKD